MLKLKFILRLLVLIFVIVGFVFMPYQQSYGREERKNIVVVGDKDYPPYGFVDESGVYKGFNVDIIKAIALETGYDLKIYYLPWWEVERYLKAGKADIILGMTYSESSRQEFFLTNSYFKDQQSIFVSSDNYIVTGIHDLQGIKVGIQRGESINKEITEKYNLNYKKVETQPEGLQMLLKGEVDAFIGNELTGRYWLQKNDKEKEIKIAGDALATFNYTFAVNKQNKDLAAELNAGLQEIKRKGTYDKIYQKWFGHSVPDNTNLIRNLLTLTIVVALVVIIIILILLRINRLLKGVVSEKTKELTDKNQELVNINSLMKSIFSNVKNGFVLIDRNLNITIYNSQLFNLFEIDPSSNVEEVKRVLEKYISFDKVINAFEKKNELLIQQLNFKANGVSKSIGYNLTLTEDSNSVVISLWDNTEEKKYLRQMLLDDKLSALGRLVSGIVHEVRNPLMTIKVLVDLIPQKIEEPKFKESLITLLPQEIDRLTSLLSELLDYSKPSESRKQLLELKKVLPSLISLLEPLLDKKGIKLTHTLDACKVFSDENHLKQILINLIFNSIEAIHSSQGHIHIEAKNLGDKTQISIRDNGLGIQEENINKIFDPFFTTKEKGTGLGLATTYQLVKENNGEILISSEPNNGTFVQIILQNSLGGFYE